MVDSSLSIVMVNIDGVMVNASGIMVDVTGMSWLTPRRHGWRQKSGAHCGQKSGPTAGKRAGPQRAEERAHCGHKSGPTAGSRQTPNQPIRNPNSSRNDGIIDVAPPGAVGRVARTASRRDAQSLAIASVWIVFGSFGGFWVFLDFGVSAFRFRPPPSWIVGPGGPSGDGDVGGSGRVDRVGTAVRSHGSFARTTQAN